VVFAPKPAAGVDWARASVDSPFGRVAIDWRIDTAEGLVADIELPFGSSGVFIAPVTAGSIVSVNGMPAATPAQLDHGRHVVTVSTPRIAGLGAG
jgi:alpha-L-rhamnosidase